MALILPVLLMLAMGTLDVGRVFGGYLALADAAREGAAYASLHSTDTGLAADVNSAITRETNGTVPGTLTVTITPSALTVGSAVDITVSAAYPLMTTAVLGWKSLTIQATASMMVQQ